MLNGFDMLAKGERILSQGLRKDLLECSAVAIGLSSNSTIREQQVEANHKLAAQFSTCISMPQGKELFMTVGSSHTTCFLKSLMYGKLEQSSNSCMQPGHPVQEALVSGWNWLILSDVLEQQWPGLPLLYSSVLNNSNSVHVASTEMEALATLQKYMASGKSMQEAITLCKQGEPVCKSYIDAIAMFAQKFCGGTDMPMVGFLVGFSKVYGESQRLGSEFTRLIAHYDFRLDANLAPCFRIACMAAQMSSPKVVDGVAKMIYKSDLDAAKKRKQELQESEEGLRDAWHVTQLAGHLSEHEKIQVFGRLCVRTVLWMLGKQKAGREEREWASFAGIRDAFADELMKKDAKPSSSASVLPAKSDIVNMVDASKASIMLVQYDHLEVGSNYTNEDHPNKVWTLTKVADEGCTFEHQPLCQPAESVSAVASELKKWKRTKKPVLICYDQAKTHDFMYESSPAASEPVELAKKQVKFYEACCSLANCSSMVSFFGPPMNVCANENIAKNKLKLVAYGQLSKLDPNSIHKVGGYSLYPFKTCTDIDKLNNTFVLVPFWFIKVSSQNPNMSLSVVKKDGFEIPCMTNSRAVKAGEVLVCEAAAQPKAKASNKRKAS
ncbi:unnamed protein product [Symbiodinium sp. CCMP2592]|nr:unnamed protein product [Symbiodinium sp. CCMP2592]